MEDPRIIIIGKSPSRKVADNVDRVALLIAHHSLMFNDQFIAMDSKRAEALNDIMVDTRGKMMSLHGTIHLKFMPDGTIIGRFDIDED